jgi:hypothetical protein
MLIQKTSSRALLEEVVLRSFLGLLDDVKRTNRGSDNIILREIKGLHSNTTKQDLPENLKKALNDMTQSMVGYIHKEGFTLVPKETK